MHYNSPRPRRSCRKMDGGDARMQSKMGFLPKDAYAVLRAYCTETTRYPDKTQLAELVEKIRRIPGCEDCKTQKIQAYFKERRRTEARARMAAWFKTSRCVKPVEVVEVDPGPSPSPISSSATASTGSTPAEPDRESPRPSPLPSSHLYSPIPSHTDVVPKTFAELAKWLQEQNRRFVGLVTP
ncbi:hypothetical protein LXA43DRAFT_76974 [Ganoderma leucocontextum]|nr:hypothetical protein LXA43DRAFT_76974 [Ganoderma leucocontextum]